MYEVIKSSNSKVLAVPHGVYDNFDNAKIAVMDLILEAFPNGCKIDCAPDLKYPGSFDWFAYDKVSSIIINLNVWKD